MTTIAFDGKTLAADTAMIAGGTKIRFTKKIRRLSTGCLAGFAGTISSGLTLLDWLESEDDDIKLELPDDDDSSALLIYPDGDVSIFDATGVEMSVLDKLVTLGSGADIALGALLAGATAVQAVEIAISRDSNSGFDVIYLNL